MMTARMSNLTAGGRDHAINMTARRSMVLSTCICSGAEAMQFIYKAFCDRQAASLI
jgi:hypothetical protein